MSYKNKNKQWSMESAKLAKAYMNGGDVPFQAARKSGFKNVTEMEMAIAELEYETAEANGIHQPGVMVMNQEADGERFMPGNEIMMETKAQPCGELVPDKEVKVGKFLAKSYPPIEGKKRMIRLWGWVKSAFIMFTPEEVGDLKKTLAEITGTQTEETGETKPEAFPEAERMGLQAEVTRLQAECGALTMEMEQAKGESKRLEFSLRMEKDFREKQGDELRLANEAIERLKARVIELETNEKCRIYDDDGEYEELREENRRLKDKLIDMIMN